MFTSADVVVVMFSDLNNFLDVEIGCLPAGQCILTVELSGSNGSFILHHFLSLALRGGTSVCFVGLSQTFHHYACVGNKLTLNLSRLQDSGKLMFVDGLSLIGGDLVKFCKTSAVPHQTGDTEDLYYINNTKAQRCIYYILTCTCGLMDRQAHWLMTSISFLYLRS